MVEGNSNLITVGPAARLLNLSTQRVRQLARMRKLPVYRTVTGIRLFRLEDVEKLASARKTRGQQEKQKGGTHERS